MKRVIFLIVLILCAATVPASAAGVKIGVVNLATVMSESEAGKRANTELQVFIQAKQASVDEQQRVVDGLKKAIEAESGTAAPEVKKAKQTELDRAAAELQRRVAASNAEINKRVQQLKDQLFQGIGPALQRVAQRSEYTVVLDAATVFYFAPVADITWEVIREFNDAGQQ